MNLLADYFRNEIRSEELKHHVPTSWWPFIYRIGRRCTTISCASFPYAWLLMSVSYWQGSTIQMRKKNRISLKWVILEISIILDRDSCFDRSKCSGLANIWLSFGQNLVKRNYSLVISPSILKEELVGLLFELYTWLKIWISLKYFTSMMLFQASPKMGGFYQNLDI